MRQVVKSVKGSASAWTTLWSISRGLEQQKAAEQAVSKSKVKEWRREWGGELGVLNACEANFLITFN